MSAAAIIIAIIGFVLSISAVLLNNRLEKTVKFLRACNELAHQWNIRRLDEGVYSPSDSAYIWFNSKLRPYNKILLSFKKLELESYFSKEEITKIFS